MYSKAPPPPIQVKYSRSHDNEGIIIKWFIAPNQQLLFMPLTPLSLMGYLTLTLWYSVRAFCRWLIVSTLQNYSKKYTPVWFLVGWVRIPFLAVATWSWVCRWTRSDIRPMVTVADYVPHVISTLALYCGTCAHCAENWSAKSLWKRRWCFPTFRIELGLNSKLEVPKRDFNVMRLFTGTLKEHEPFTRSLNGAHSNNGPVVDVGLVRLGANIDVPERCTPCICFPASRSLKRGASNPRPHILEEH